MDSIRVKSYGIKSYDDKFRYWEKYGVKITWDRNKKKPVAVFSSAHASSENDADGTEESTIPQQPEN